MAFQPLSSFQSDSGPGRDRVAPAAQLREAVGTYREQNLPSLDEVAALTGSMREEAAAVLRGERPQAAIPEPEQSSGYALIGGLRQAWSRVGDVPRMLPGAIQTIDAALGDLGIGKGVQEGEYNQARIDQYQGWVNTLFGDREKIDAQYASSTWDAVKENPFSMATLNFIAKEGVGNLPDMAAMIFAPLIYGGARTLEITEERRENTGEKTNLTDIGIAGVTAGVSLIGDRVGLRFLGYNPFTKGKKGTLLRDNIVKAGKMAAAKRVTGAVAGEAGTEAAQEYLEYVGANVARDFSDIIETSSDPAAFESALIGAVASTGIGVTVATAADLSKTREGATSPWSPPQKGPGADEQAAVADQKELDLQGGSAPPRAIPEQGELDLRGGEGPVAPEQAPEGQLPLPFAGSPPVGPEEEQLGLPLQTPEVTPSNRQGIPDPNERPVDPRAPVDIGAEEGAPIPVGSTGYYVDAADPETEAEEYVAGHDQKYEDRAEKHASSGFGTYVDAALGDQKVSVSDRAFDVRVQLRSILQSASRLASARADMFWLEARRLDQYQRTGFNRLKTKARLFEHSSQRLQEAAMIANNAKDDPAARHRVLAGLSEALDTFNQSNLLEHPSLDTSALSEAVRSSNVKDMVRQLGRLNHVVKARLNQLSKQEIGTQPITEGASTKETTYRVARPGVVAKGLRQSAESNRHRAQPKVQLKKAGDLTEPTVVNDKGEVTSKKVRLDDLDDKELVDIVNDTLAKVREQVIKSNKIKNRARNAYAKRQGKRAPEQLPTHYQGGGVDFDRDTGKESIKKVLARRFNINADNMSLQELVEALQSREVEQELLSQQVVEGEEGITAAPDTVPDAQKPSEETKRKQKAARKARFRERSLSPEEKEALEGTQVSDKDRAELVDDLFAQREAAKRSKDSDDLNPNTTGLASMEAADARAKEARRLAAKEAHEQSIAKVLRTHKQDLAWLQEAVNEAAASDPDGETEQYKKAKAELDAFVDRYGTESTFEGVAKAMQKRRRALQKEDTPKNVSRQLQENSKVSGTIKPRARGSSGAIARSRARAAWNYFKTNSSVKDWTDVLGIVRAARAKVLGSNGVSGAWVFDERNARKGRINHVFKWVPGAYPKAAHDSVESLMRVQDTRISKEVMDWTTRRVIKARRIQPREVDDALVAEFPQLKKHRGKQFFLGNEVEIWPTKAGHDSDFMKHLSRFEPPETDSGLRIRPEAYDEMLERLGNFVNSNGMPIVDKDGNYPPTKALAEMLLGLNTTKLDVRVREARKRRADKEPPLVVVSGPQGPTAQELEEEPEVDDNDPDNIDEEELARRFAEALKKKLGGTANPDELRYIELTEKIDNLKQGIATSKKALSDGSLLKAFSEVNNKTPDDQVVPFEADEGIWGLFRHFRPLAKGDKVGNKIGTDGDRIVDGKTVKARRRSWAEAEAELRIDNAEIELQKLIDERNSSGTSTSTSTSRPKKSSPDGDGPAPTPAVQPAVDGRRTAGVAPLDLHREDFERVSKREPRDNFAGASPAFDQLSEAVRRAVGAFVNRVAGVKQPLDGILEGSTVQRDGAALAFSRYKQGYGGFANFDAAGTGKTHQLGALAGMIAEDQEKAGTRKPVLIVAGMGRSDQLLTKYKDGTRDEVLKNLGMSSEATYSNGTKKFKLLPYNAFDRMVAGEYAAVLVDEAHNFKGEGPRGTNFDRLNTKFRAVFTATPSDKPGQEIWFLKHVLLKSSDKGDHKGKAEYLKARLGVDQIYDAKNKKTDYILKGVTGGVGSPQWARKFAEYLHKLGLEMGDVIRSGGAVSRMYPRVAKFQSFSVDEDVDIDGIAEAARKIEEVLGPDPDSDMARSLMEYMKMPTMVLQAEQNAGRGIKTVAVFTAANPPTRLLNIINAKKKSGNTTRTEQRDIQTREALISAGLSEETLNLFKKPAIALFDAELNKRLGLGRSQALYGEGSSRYKDTFVALFKRHEGKVRPMVTAVTYSAGSTGIDLNDAYVEGSNDIEPRHMLMATTSQEGTQFLQMLGRTDRSNNRSTTLISYVKLDGHPADEIVRARIREKVNLQNIITGSGQELSAKDTHTESDPQTLLLRSREDVQGVRSDQGIIQTLRKGDTHKVRDLLRAALVESDNESLNNLIRFVLSRGGASVDRVGVYLMSDEEVAANPKKLGFYDPRSGRIKLSAETGITQTLIHEAIHAMTHHRVEADINGARQLRALIRAAVNINPKLATFGNYVRPGNEHEFIAQAFSNPEFQQALRDTNMGAVNSLSMWQRFMRWVRSILRMPVSDGTALSKIMDLDLIETSKDLTPKGKTAHKVAIYLQTYDQVVQTYKSLGVRPVLEGGLGGGNVLEDMLDLTEKKNAEANRRKLAFNHKVLEKFRKFATGKGKEMTTVDMGDGSQREVTQLEYFSYLVNLSGYNKIHFGKSKTDRDNRMVKTQRESEFEYDLHKKQFDKDKHSELAKLYNDIAEFFAEERQARSAALAGQYLDTLFPEPGNPWSMRKPSEVMKEVRRLLKGEDLTADQQDKLAELATTKEALNELKQIMEPGVTPGAYFPLKRYGDHVVVLSFTKDYKDAAERDALLAKYPGAKVQPETRAEAAVYKTKDGKKTDEIKKPAVQESPNGKIIYKEVARFESKDHATEYRLDLMDRTAGLDEGVDNFKLSDVISREKPMTEMQGGQRSTFSALTSNFVSQLDKRGDDLSPEEYSTLKDTFARAVLDMLPETSVAHNMRKREGIPGATMDIERVLHDYGASSGHLISNLMYGRQQSELLQEFRGLRLRKERTGNPKDLRDSKVMQEVYESLARRHLNSVDPDKMLLGDTYQTISDVGFFYYLVGASYNLVNMTQPLLVGGPELASRHGLAKSHKAMGDALNIMGWAPYKKLLKTGGSLSELKNIMRDDFDRTQYSIVDSEDGIIESIKQSDIKNKKELVRLMRDMVELGDVEASLAMDMARGRGQSHIYEKDGKSLLGREYKKGEARPQKFHHYLFDWMRMAPHLTEVGNRSIMAIAAFNLEYEKNNGDYEKAKKYARRVVKDTQFVYQSWNDSPLFQPQFFRTLLMFKKHVQGMYFYMARRMVQSFKGATPEERSEARKAFAHFMVVHMAAAGLAGGLAEPLKWLMNLGFWMFDDDDDPLTWEKFVRNTAYEIGGKPLANFASYGALGPLGIDISTRVGIDNMLMFNGPDASSRESMAYSLLEIAGGPMAGLGFRSVDSLNHFKRGDLYRGVESIMPKFVRDIMQAGRFETQGMKSLSGETYVDASEFNWLDTSAKFIGFSPTQLSNAYGVQQIKRDHQKMRDKRTQLMTAYYKALSKGDQAKVVSKIRDWNKANPDFYIRPSQLKQSVRRHLQNEQRMHKGMVLQRSSARWQLEQTKSY